MISLSSPARDPSVFRGSHDLEEERYTESYPPDLCPKSDTPFGLLSRMMVVLHTPRSQAQPVLPGSGLVLDLATGEE